MARGCFYFFVLLLGACGDPRLIVTNDPIVDLGIIDLGIDATDSEPHQDLTMPPDDDAAVEKQPDTACSDAKRLTLVAGHAEVRGDTRNHMSELFEVTCDGGWSLAGGPLRMDGPQAYFVFTGTKDHFYRLRVTAEFEQTHEPRGGPALYVFTRSACTGETITQDCSSKGLFGAFAGLARSQNTALVFKAPRDGDIFVAVDSYLADQAGPFTLEVDAISQPANRECSSAAWLSFPDTDGCNRCTCTPDGSDVVCTAMNCNKQCPEGVGWLVDAGADYLTPADSCPCEAPIEGSSCGEEGALCTYLLIYCPWQITGYEYENSLYECVDGKWASQGQDCYDCCRPPSQPMIACGDASCDGNEYCLKLGCGTPGCSVPPPHCEPLPSECFDCDCLTKSLNDPTSGFADICGGTVPAVCLGSYPELRIDCPGV